MPRPRRPPELPREAPAPTEQWGRALAQVIRGWRAQHRQTAQQLADRGALDVRQVQRLERGDGNPTLESLLRVAAAMGLSPAQLFVAMEASCGAPPRPPPMPSPPTAAPKHASPPRRPRSEPAMARVALALRERRARLSISQTDLAARAGLSRSKVQSIETKRHAATLDTLDALAKALGCDVTDLVSPANLKR